MRNLNFGLCAERRRRNSVSGRNEFGREANGNMCPLYIFGAVRDSNPSGTPRCSSRIGWTAPGCCRGKRKTGGVQYVCGHPARARWFQRQWCGEYGSESWDSRTSQTPGWTNWPHRVSSGLWASQRVPHDVLHVAGKRRAEWAEEWEWTHHPESCAWLLADDDGRTHLPGQAEQRPTEGAWVWRNGFGARQADSPSEAPWGDRAGMA